MAKKRTLIASSWPEEKLSRLRHYLDQGISLSSCAVRFHCCLSTIRNQIKAMGKDTDKASPKTRKRTEPWTEEMKTELIKAMADNPGAPRSKIAKLLGVSKNVIAGQVYRLQKKGVLRPNNVSEPPTPEPPPPPPVPAPPPLSVARTFILPDIIGDRLPRTASEHVTLRTRKAAFRTGIRTSGIAEKVLALRANQCRYIHGDPIDPSAAYCEEDKTVGKAYCEEHAAACVAPTPKYLDQARR